MVRTRIINANFNNCKWYYIFGGGRRRTTWNVHKMYANQKSLSYQRVLGFQLCSFSLLYKFQDGILRTYTFSLFPFKSNKTVLEQRKVSLSVNVWNSVLRVCMCVFLVRHVAAGAWFVTTQILPTQYIRFSWKAF